MVLATSSFGKDRRPEDATRGGRLQISTRAALLLVLLPLTFVFIGTSLWLVWHQVQAQGQKAERVELEQSVRAFGAAELDRYASLQRETALLAEVPNLKALLTTNDDRTIQDAAQDFWRTSGSALFALADPAGRVRAIYGPPGSDLTMLSRDLARALPEVEERYLVSGGHLFHFAASPVRFGDEVHGTPLGTVVSGYQIDGSTLERLSGMAGTEAAFYAGSELVGSSMAAAVPHTAPGEEAVNARGISMFVSEGKPYLAESRDLSSFANRPLRVMFSRSLLPARQAAHAISRSMLVLGGWMTLIGCLVMAVVARRVTQPLEALAQRVEAFGRNKSHAAAPVVGTQEVNQLARNFDRMVERVVESNRAQLEAERLATIGSMATSVSHDLRHNLATIYAHAEFLMSRDIDDEERNEFFENIRGAVLDTTEMLESLTTFSRTGQTGRLMPESLDMLIGKAVGQVHLHPAAARVVFSRDAVDPALSVHCDANQLQRALRNLLLNACQCRRPQERAPCVAVHVRCGRERISISVRDNGEGVPKSLQGTLFDPFVSAGKQDGTGLGLTLARRIAEDHGGSLLLVRTGEDGSIFELTVPVVPMAAPVVHGQTPWMVTRP